jgi:hypothetical protein
MHFRQWRRREFITLLGGVASGGARAGVAPQGCRQAHPTPSSKAPSSAMTGAEVEDLRGGRWIYPPGDNP